jgi:Predicted membrane protein (DUF2142)
MPRVRWARAATAIEWLRARPTVRWCTTFVLVATLCGLWSLATPLFAAADEPAHVVRAASVARGEFIGAQPANRKLRKTGFLEVKLPAIYNAAESIDCFAYKKEVPASCMEFSGSETATRKVLTSAGRHPPAYYAVVGLISRVWPHAAGGVYLMRFLTLLMTAAFLATAVNALWRTGAPRLAALGLATAVTPMVLFVGSVVNPNSLEIAAAVALWACGAALMSHTGDEIDASLVAQVGIASAALIVSRPLSPLWFAVIAVILATLASRQRFVQLVRCRAAWLWGGVVASALASQGIWILSVKQFENLGSTGPYVGQEPSVIVRASIGFGYLLYVQMIGVFGWLDTPIPNLGLLALTSALAGLVITAVLFGRRRVLLPMLLAAAVTILAPAVIVAQQLGRTGIGWQGRYTLPIGVGVPILAGFALAQSRWREVVAGSLLRPIVGVAVVVGHVLAYAQALRRYTVGYDGPLQFWKNPSWRPPIPVLALTVAFTISVVAFVVWLLATESPPKGGRPETATIGAHREVDDLVLTGGTHDDRLG